MRLATLAGPDGPRLALAFGAEPDVRLVDIAAAAGLLDLAPPEFGDDPLRRLLEGGAAASAHIAALDARVRAAPERVAAATIAPAEAVFLPPILRPSKILAAGRNYRRPGQPTAAPDGAGPPIFAKFPSTLVGHGRPVRYPAETARLDYEAELAVVIGRTCRGVARADALAFVAGYTVFNDLTMSDVQRREVETGLMMFGKNADDTGPCGPWLVTSDEIADPDALRIGLDVNGAVRQDDSTAAMLFDVASLVAYCSRMTLEPGDIIATGTPAGVAAQRAEPDAFFLRPGDVVEAWVEGVGRLRNRIVPTDGVTA